MSLASLKKELRALRAENALLRMQAAGPIGNRQVLRRIGQVLALLRLGGRNTFTIARELACSPKTIQRDLAFIRGSLRVPLVFDPRRNVWKFPAGVSFNWFGRDGRAATPQDDLASLIHQFNRKKT